MTLTLLIVAAVATCLAIAGRRDLFRREDALTITWVFLVAAWPFISVYFVLPLVWATAADAGIANPAVSYLPAALCSFVVLCQGLRSEGSEVSLPAVMIGCLFFFVAAATWFAGLPQMFHFGMAATLFSAVLLKRRPTSIETLSRAVQPALAILLVCTAVSALINSDRVLAPCREDKCGLLPIVFTSPFAGNGNVLGMVTVLLLPIACAALPMSRMILMIVGVGAMQLVAVSRTATFAFVVVSVTLVLIRSTRSPRWQLGIAFAALVLGLAASLYPLTVSFSGNSFSFRGYVWEAGRQAIGESPVFGHGPSFWHLLADNALFEPNYSPHNGWYDLTVAVGLFGTVVIVAAVVVQIRSTAARTRIYLVTYYATVLSINMFESVFVPYFFLITPFAALIALMLYDPEPMKDEELEQNLVAFERPRGGIDPS